jgi:hypothetical protein
MFEAFDMALELNDRSKQARELAEMWSRVSRQHLTAGAGCSCGIGGLMLQASDFELDIVEFVINDARKEKLAGLEAFIDAVAARGPDRYSLSDLLKAIGSADHPTTPSSADLQFALDRLRKTLSSMDANHNRSRFACD